MFVPRLDTDRQIVVGNHIKLALAADRPTPLTPAVRARGDVVIASTIAVSLFAKLRPVDVDRATDKVVIGLERTLTYAGDWMLHDGAVPHGEAQHLMVARIRQLRTHLFPQGTGFTQGTMDLKWSHLVNLRSGMQEPAIAAAIDALGLRPYADHVLAHIDLYGRMLGQQGGKASAGEAQANAAWNEAFRVFAAQVVADYHADAAIQEELLGGYQAQLEQKRAVARAERNRRARGPAAQPAPAPAPAGSAPAPAPAGSAPAPAPAGSAPAPAPADSAPAPAPAGSAPAPAPADSAPAPAPADSAPAAVPAPSAPAAAPASSAPAVA
ncbi:MAG: hypothetical protein IT372_40105 [Polyangiaceae bacterium]|nr:hypothetical protein [Polyangiaceae bacterium]